MNPGGTALAQPGGMRIKSTLVILLSGGMLIALAAAFPLWADLTGLFAMCTLLGAFTAWLVNTDEAEGTREIARKKAA
jgi:hypothetical protein